MIAGLACTSAVAPAAAQPARTYPDATCLVSTVPLYSPDMWKSAAGRSPETDVGIANWGSNTRNGGAGGPGKHRSAADAARIATAGADGTRILGYIATDYARGAAGYGTASIEIQMTDWHRWYGVTAFFLDEVPTATTHQRYYAALKAWAHRHIAASAQEWLNMGAYPAASSWIEGAHAGAGFVTSDVSYQTLPSWSYWTRFSTAAASPGCTQ
jgi:hypothetical protein